MSICILHDKDARICNMCEHYGQLVHDECTIDFWCFKHNGYNQPFETCNDFEKSSGDGFWAMFASQNSE